MTTPRSELAATSYLTRRRIAAMIAGEPAPDREPLRRPIRSGGVGVAVAAMTIVTVALVGMLTGISTAPLPDNGAITVKGTSDRYLVIDGVVHPALSLSSALLAGGGTLHTVGAETVARAPKGPPVGIPGSPDVLPDRGRLATGPWTVCTGDDPLRPHLLIGVPPPAPVDAGSAALVRDEPGQTWLLTADGRYRLTASAYQQLGLGDAGPLLVADALLQLVQVRATATSITSEAERRFDLVVAPQSPLCLSIRVSASAPVGQVSVALPPALPTSSGTAPVGLDGPSAAASITVAGSGSLVYDAAAPGAERRYNLVTDAAVRYPLGSAEAATRLGYDPGGAAAVPAGLLALIPAGPTLDIAAARSIA